MTTSNRQGITELSEGQNNRSVTVNEAIASLEAGASRFCANSVGDTSPPGSAVEGDLYVLGSGPSGAWAGKGGNIAIYYNGAWLFIPPIEGYEAYAQDDNTEWIYQTASSPTGWALNTGGGGSGVSSSRQIISGAGLTGGGDLSADRTLAVGAGTGITVNADDVAIDKATDAEVRSAASNQVMTTDLIESASAFVTLTDASNIALDWDAGINRSLTIGGNRTLDNPTNGQPGTWRTIMITQDGTGGRTLAFGNQYKFPAGTEPVLTSAAGSVDILNLLCVTTTNFFVFYANDMKA